MEWKQLAIFSLNWIQATLYQLFYFYTVYKIKILPWGLRLLSCHFGLIVLLILAAFEICLCFACCHLTYWCHPLWEPERAFRLNNFFYLIKCTGREVRRTAPCRDWFYSPSEEYIVGFLSSFDTQWRSSDIFRSLKHSGGGKINWVWQTRAIPWVLVSGTLIETRQEIIIIKLSYPPAAIKRYSPLFLYLYQSIWVMQKF